MGGDEADRPLDEEGSGVDRSQRPMEVDRSRYYETGQLNVTEGPLGQLPVIGGEAPAPPGSGLTVDNFVCNAAPGRPACEYYAAVLLPADGEARGFGPMRQIRRFCRAMATASELFELDGDLYACTLRKPVHEPSVRAIEAFEAKQRAIAEETNETSGKLDF